MDKNHYTKFPSVNSKKNNVRIKKNLFSIFDMSNYR
jgi:hypothetical protein